MMFVHTSPVRAVATWLLLIMACYACNPGPGTGRRRVNRNARPLRIGESVPAMSETTLGASGPSEGRIVRGTSRYAALQTNVRANDIIYDRANERLHLMTKRCKDRVNALALLVQSRWPRLRLRVLRSYIDHQIYKLESPLHYEGRAVDFITSDNDRNKIGYLARLAVMAGFDWVRHKRTFVHASVVAENSDMELYGGCFTADSSVHLKSGETIPMSQLKVGDSILASVRSSGALQYSEVVAFLDKDSSVSSSFIEVNTDRGKLTLTPNHMLFVADQSCMPRNSTTSESGRSFTPDWRNCANAIHASRLKVGQIVFATPPGGLKPIGSLTLAGAKVAGLRRTQRRGVFAPLTKHGTLVVDHIVASCYGVYFSEPLAHAALYPLRTFTFFQLSSTMGKSDAGIHWYPKALLQGALTILPKSMFQLV